MNLLVIVNLMEKLHILKSSFTFTPNTCPSKVSTPLAFAFPRVRHI